MQIIKKIKHIFEDKKISAKTITNTVLGALLAASLGVVFVSNYTIGYNVVISGKNVGFTDSKDDARAVIDKINEQYRPYFSGEDAIYDEPVYAMKLLSRESITDDAELEENIKASSSQMVKQYVIVVNGIDVAGLRTEKAAKEVLEEYKSKYYRSRKWIFSQRRKRESICLYTSSF